MRGKRFLILGSLAAGIALVVVLATPLRGRVHSLWTLMRGRKTVAERVEEFGPAVRERLRDDLERIGQDWPPARVVLLGLKAERRLEVWVGDASGALRHLRDLPVLGASGGAGPKLKEGDLQVPEGIYRIESLNPNSRFHLALRVDYPNAFDRRQAEAEGREDLGSDIMIHGGTSSVGCLAMGDPAAEELFVLVAETGLEKVSLILSPRDPRRDGGLSPEGATPPWIGRLYQEIEKAAAPLRR